MDRIWSSHHLFIILAGSKFLGRSNSPQFTILERMLNVGKVARDSTEHFCAFEQFSKLFLI